MTFKYKFNSEGTPPIPLKLKVEINTREHFAVVGYQSVEIGVLRMERRDTAQGAMLRQWFEQWVLVEFRDRTLMIDTAIARAGARLHVPAPRPERDALIAATALTHGLTVVTRNTADFESMGVTLLNPWLATGA